MHDREDGAVTEAWIARLAGTEAEPLLELNGATATEAATGHVHADAVGKLERMTGGDPLGLQLVAAAATRLVLRSMSGKQRHVVVMPLPGAKPTEVALAGDLDADQPVSQLLGRMHRELEQVAPVAWSNRTAVGDRLASAGACDPEVLSQIAVRHEAVGGSMAATTVAITLRNSETGMTVELGRQNGRIPAAAGMLARCVAAALSDIAGNVGQPCREVDVLGEDQRAELLRWSGTASAYEARDLVQIADAAVRSAPGAPAIDDGTLKWSHAELHRRTRGAANHLATRYGVGRGDRVALLLPRGPQLVLAILAILRAGASYVPLDPAHPAARVNRQLRLSGAGHVISQVAGLEPPEGIEVIDAAELLGASEALNGAELLDTTDNAGATGRRNIEPFADDEAVLFFTSGSTGDPRPVALTHRQLAHKAVAAAQWAGFDSDTRFALLSAISSDALTYQIFTTLSAGGCMVPLPSADQLEPGEFWELLDERRVNALNCVPSVLAVMAEGIPAGNRRHLRHCFLGGDEVAAGLLPRLASRLSVGTFANLYGPTEATVEAVSFRCSGDEWPQLAVVPIGRPSPGFSVRVLTRHGELAPVGVPGEMYIMGEGVAEGYLDDEPSGPDRFIRLPDQPDVKTFKTGDFARWNADGTLHFLGRADNQIQVHGNRVELAEVEKALAEVDGVNSGTVVPIVDAAKPTRLVAAYTSKSGISGESVRRKLSELLPRHMVPGVVARWEELPTTIHGKVDRRSIAEQAIADDTAVWQTDDESGRLVVDAWTHVLGRAPRTGDEDFISAGGHSLTATMLVRRLCELAGDGAITVREVFAARTPSGLSAALRRPRATISDVDSANLPTRAAASNAQQRLWFLEQYAEGSLRPYNMVESFRLRELVTVDQLRHALGEVVERHQALRTVLVSAKDGLEQVVRPVGQLPVDVAEYRVNTGELAKGLSDVTAAEQLRRMDLATGPLLHANWVTDGDDGVLVLCVHHAVCDGWSFAVILRDLQAALSRQPRTEPVQYIQHSRELEARQQGDQWEDDREYWHGVLANLPDVDIPLDRHRTARRDSAGGVVWSSLGEQVTQRLHALCRQLGITPFAGLVGIVRVLLYRQGRQSDIPLGAVMSGRDDPRLVDSVGMFANTVVLRTIVDPRQGFRELITEVAGQLDDARLHQDYPFELLVDELGGDRVSGRNPVFDVLVESLLSGTDPVSGGGGVEHLPASPEYSDFDLAVGFADGGPATPIEVAISYRGDVLDRETVERLADQLKHLAQGLLDTPDAAVAAVPFMPDQQRDFLLDTVNRTQAPFPRQSTLLSLVDEQVRRHPELTAVVCDDRTLGFAELDRRANRLAYRLAQDSATGPNELIAVACDRTEWMVVALLAVLKTGSAFMPLDPEQPAERLITMVRAAKARAVLCDLPLADSLTEIGVPVVNPAHGLDSHPGGGLATAAPSDLAYVVHTSGSTGVPKGVMVEHRGIVNTVHYRAGYYGFDTGACVLQVPPIHFDSGINDVFSALVAGSPVVVMSREALLDPDEVAARIEANQVTHIMMVPSLYQVLLNRAASALSSVRQVVLVGERLSESLVARHSRLLPDTVLYNEYGPAEDSVWTTVHRITDSAADVLIGHPIANKTVDLLDEDGELVAVGLAGEICVGGAGVSRGYLNDPVLTASRFRENPVRPGTRMYRTGDLARRRANGDLQYLGRVDDQVKIRGQRVEPGEVSAVLSRAPGIANAAVVAQVSEDGETRLIAYVVKDSAALDPRKFLAERLPDVMIPAVFVPIPELPVTVNGKLDKRALPAPPAEKNGVSVDMTEAQSTIAQIWSKLLGREVTDPDMNLFELGGHSLTAARIGQELGVSIRVVMENQTVRRLAEAIDATQVPRVRSAPSAPGIEASVFPLSKAQRRIWLGARRESADSYIISDLVRLHRAIDPDVLTTALEEVVSRHQMLRVSMRKDGAATASQVTVDSLADGVPLRVMNLAGCDPDGERVAAALRQAREVAWDIERPPLFELRLLSGVSGGDLLTVTAHHLVYDGASVDVLLTDLFTAYDNLLSGRPHGLARPRQTFSDWVAREKVWLESEQAAVSAKFWRRTLEEPPPSPDLFAAARRRAVRGRSYLSKRELPWSLVEGGTATPYAVIVTAFAVMMHRRTGVRDLVIGFPVSLRDDREADELIGCLVNGVPLRLELDPRANLGEVLRHVSGRILEAYEHSRLPFDVIVEDLRLHTRPGRNLLFDLGVTWENATVGRQNYEVEDVLSHDMVAQNDLWMYAARYGDKLRLEQASDSNLVTTEEAEELADQIAELVSAIVTGPDAPMSTSIHENPLWSETRYDF